MKPPAFTYHRPASVADALAVLAETGPDGKVLAGGQSLVPVLNMRLAAPGHLVDINRLGELAHVTVDAGVVRVGALARHAAVERDAAARAAYVSVGPTPLTVDLAEAVAGLPADTADWAAAGALAAARVRPEDDIHATAAYRRHLVAVLTARAGKAAVANA